MSASEPEETAKEPQSGEERLGESMIPLTQLGLTDPAVPNESDQSFSFTSYLYLPTTPRLLMPSVRGSDNDCDIECEIKSVVKCDEQTKLRLENRRLRLACLYVLYSQLRLDRQLHLAL